MRKTSFVLGPLSVARSDRPQAKDDGAGTTDKGLLTKDAFALFIQSSIGCFRFSRHSVRKQLTRPMPSHYHPFEVRRLRALRSRVVVGGAPGFSRWEPARCDASEGGNSGKADAYGNS